MNPLLQALIVWVAPTLIAYKIGVSKQRAGLWYGLLLSWLGVLIIASLPDKDTADERRDLRRMAAQRARFAADDDFDDDFYDAAPPARFASAPAQAPQPGQHTCPQCKGGMMMRCPQCGGNLVVKLTRGPERGEWLPQIYEVPCPACSGSGKVPCGTCRGSGTVFY